MSVGSKMTWVGMAGLAILLGVRGACLAGAEEPSAANLVASDSDDDANPYSIIAQRNVFGLNPPPAAPEPDKGPPPNLPVVRLSGFMRKGDPWKVLLAVEVENPDPHGHALTCYLTLAEGDKKTVGSGSKQGVLELVKAYADLEKVDIINAGTPMTLSLKENGIASSPPSPVGRGAVPPIHKHIGPGPPPPTRPPREETLTVGEGAVSGATAAANVPSPVPSAPPPMGSPAPPEHDAPNKVIVAGGSDGPPK
jgi:hypothetical protein